MGNDVRVGNLSAFSDMCETLGKDFASFSVVLYGLVINYFSPLPTRKVSVIAKKLAGRVDLG